MTLFRKPSPDLAVGNGTAEDDARWIPGGVYWKVTTDRARFSESHLTFYYRPAEIQGLGLDPSKLSVYYAKPDSPPTSTTSWTLMSVSYDPDRGALVVDRTHNNLDTAQDEFNGYYAIVQANFFVELGQNIPTVGLVIGSAIVIASGLFLLWHESRKARTLADIELADSE